MWQNGVLLQGNRPLAQGIIYAVTQEDVKNSKTVITGTLFLHNHPTYVLFGTNATHLFISKQFVQLARLELKPLEIALSIATLMKNEVLSTLGCPECKNDVCGQEETIDLVVLPMYNLDIIIGMDRLSKQRANVDYYSKMIWFSPPNHPSYTFVGNGGRPSTLLVSTLEATRLLN